MAIGISEKHDIALDVFGSKNSLQELIKDKSLYPDDLEKIVNRLNKAIEQLNAKSELDNFKQAVSSLKAMNISITGELLEKGRALAGLFPEDQDLKEFQPKSKGTRNKVHGTYHIGDLKVKGVNVGKSSNQIIEAVEAYNLKNGTDLEPKDLRDETKQRNDFKFVPDSSQEH